jgi:glycosyltransferase involved in cell wall biosynthesis
MKISVIMQSYLGEYPGSRTHARQKFTRAVNSFLAQTLPQKELIIVSDGCVLTRVIYELVYSTFSNIKLVTVPDADIKRMYTTTTGGKKCFRGIPRGVGVKQATGDLITYLDTDDIWLPTHLEILHCSWLNAPKEVMWASNNFRLMHAKLPDMKVPQEPCDAYSTEAVDLSAYGILEPFYVSLSASRNQVNCASYLLSHRREVKAQWEDTENEHEDARFAAALQKFHGNSMRVYSPTIVVCHYRSGWDV